jgi:hypothetical protein
MTILKEDAGAKALELEAERMQSGEIAVVAEVVVQGERSWGGSELAVRGDRRTWGLKQTSSR